ncbi:MAG TPA: response regulator FixJ [Candidatus Sulfotelmatobacter sp.]|nr:response regulator FixJ [Candidatus Sulfotelmatobacter sp.]
MRDNAATIFVVDDDDAVRDSLQILLQTEGYGAEAYGSGRAFLDGYRAGGRGCLVTDVRMPDMSGLELQQAVIARRLELPVVVMTGQADIPIAVEAMKAGAIDFLEKPFPDSAILDALRRALAGDGARALAARARDAADRARGLSPRERQVLEWLVQGLGNKAIARELAISPRTVEVHRARVMEKMQADSLSQLVRLALAAKAA